MRNIKFDRVILPILTLVCSNILFGQSKIVDNETITANDGTKTYLIGKSLSIKPPTSGSATFSATTTASYIFKMINSDPKYFPPSEDQNFVRTETVLIKDVTNESVLPTLPVDQKNTSYEYIDGLGRKLQSVSVQGSPLLNDIVVPFKYDNGRMRYEYLPFTASGLGAFKTSQEDGTVSFYANPPSGIQNDSRPFNENIFEASPLNRVTNKFGPGTDWFTNSRDVKSVMKLNQAADNIIRWDYYVSGIPTQNGIYAANHLTIQESIDEENQITREYKDSRGLLVLRRVGDGTSWFDTHYIYSPSGLLMIVVQPEGVARLATEFDAGGVDKQSFLNRWCFQYQYDDEQRLIAKRIPGWEPNHWAYTIYDKWNRVVFTQTPAQSARNEWFFNKYDRFNRVIMTGLHTYSTAGDIRAALQLAVNNYYVSNPNNRFETEANTEEGYTLTTTYPNPGHGISAASLRSVTYYDYYTFLSLPNWEREVAVSSFNFQNISGYPQYNGSNASVSEIFLEVKGHPTGSKTRVLGTTRWLNTVTWYDKKYRPIQIISENYVGGVDRSTSLVDFTGKTKKSLLTHSSTTASISILNEFDYDHAGRLLKTYQSMDGGTPVLLTSNVYNELGQLIEKNIHSTDGSNFLQSVDMRYNIRGWLTNINNSTLTNDGTKNNDANDLFGMEMLYKPATSTTVNGYTLPQLYNGNISAIKWMANTQQGTPEERIFGFDYDVLNRFEKAYYATNNAGSWTGNAGMFDEAVRSYDKNGNMRGIERYSKVQGNRTRIDSTYYGYNYVSGILPNFTGVSNRLLKLKDAGNSLGFKDSPAQTNEEFKYDRSGNLTYDQNKQISNITYNYLNLPEIIEFTITSRPSNPIDRIVYTYDASGAKLRTEIYQYGTPSATPNGTKVWTTDYVGGIQYDQSQNQATRVLSFVATPEGRVLKNSSGWDYEYFYKDHQGNVRLTYGQLKETVSYRATMETQLASTEGQNFPSLSNTADGDAHYPNATFNYTKSSDKVLTPDKSFRTYNLSGTNKTIGPAITLTLGTGDKVTAEVFATYTVYPGTGDIAGTVLGTVLAGNAYNYSLGETRYAALQNNASAISGRPQSSSTVPGAYLAFLFFDLNYQFIPSASKATPVTAGAYNAFEKLAYNFTAPQAGYLYVYTANESNNNINVFWDEMLVVHQKNNTALQVTQASDYYPFGLPFNTYQSLRINDNYSNVQNNRYGFQGQEWQSDLDLSWSQFKWRMHDPAIGRFGAVDPLSDKYLHNSTFAFSENKIISHVELEGLESVPMFTEWAVDMSKAPDFYKSVSGRTLQSSYNLHGWPQNYLYYWDEVLKMDASALDAKNASLVQKYGAAPRVTPELINHLKGKGFDVSGLKLGEVVEHHHINQGRTAVGIGSSNHKTISNQRSGFSVNTKSGSNLSKAGALSNTLNVLGVLTMFSGSMTGNPHSMWSMFETNGFAKLDKVYYNSESDLYSVASSFKDTEDGRFVTFSTYRSYAWDEGQRKYVGTGLIGTYDYFIYKDTNFATPAQQMH
jgi:RHS repeat-associated protein